MARHSAGITRARRKAFLDAFGDCGVIRRACELTGVAERSHYDWLERSIEYRKQFARAEERAIQALEIELRRRAAEGFEDPVYYQGRHVGQVRRYSDLLLIFLLKAKRPDVYREVREQRITGGLTNHTVVTVVHELHDSPAALPPPSSYTPQLPPKPDTDSDSDN